MDAADDQYLGLFIILKANALGYPDAESTLIMPVLFLPILHFESILESKSIGIRPLRRTYTVVTDMEGTFSGPLTILEHVKVIKLYALFDLALPMHSWCAIKWKNNRPDLSHPLHVINWT